MSTEHSPADEMSQLVDLLYDGKIDHVGFDRIQSLILQDQRHLQTYVERFDFHCELHEQADHKPTEMMVLDVLHQSATTLARQESRQQWRAGILLLTCGIILGVGFGWLYYSTFLYATPVGTIASFSADLGTTSRTFEPGQVIRQRETISISKGILSVQLPEVMIDLIGPASIRFENSGRVLLTGGKVIANVDPKGIGFTVKTPETEVVDLGTEFLVRHHRDEGTYVSVRRGVAQARHLDWRGDPVKMIELTTSRAARFQQSDGVAKEVAYSGNDYLPVDQSRGGIRRLSGALRTLSEIPASLKSEQVTTPNHMLIIPERQITLEADLQVNSLSGPVRIPAGTTVNSYLIHYDPTLLINSGPRGAVTFHGQVAAVIGSATELITTDSLFGLAETSYESQAFRELELDEDEVQISDDRRTVSFFFGITPPKLVDEARILLIHESP